MGLPVLLVKRFGKIIHYGELFIGINFVISSHLGVGFARWRGRGNVAQVLFKGF